MYKGFSGKVILFQAFGTFRVPKFRIIRNQSKAIRIDKPSQAEKSQTYRKFQVVETIQIYVRKPESAEAEYFSVELPAVLIGLEPGLFLENL